MFCGQAKKLPPHTHIPNTDPQFLLFYFTENFSALTRLDHNRAVGQLALKAGADVEDVVGAIIWGNHSSTQYPDISSATIKGEIAIQPLPHNCLL